MKTIILSLCVAIAFIAIAGLSKADANVCPAGKECAWFDVTNVTNFGLSASPSSQRFWNDQATKDKLCQLSGYDNNYGASWATQLGKWSKCNGEYHVDWRGYWDSHLCGSDSYVSNIYCVRPIDVCPNIDGIQASVPSDKVKNAAGDCVDPEPADMCPNISGVQGSVPANMSVVDGDCECNSGYSMNSSNQCIQNPQNTPPTGSLTATCTSLSGTANDSDTANQSVSIHFYVDGPAGSGTFIGNTSTNSADDYSMATPSSVKNNTNRTIYAYALDTNSGPSAGIGQATINCPAPVVTTTTTSVPSGSLGVSPSSLPAGGGNVVVSWSVQGASACTASNAWTGTKSTSGQETKAVTQTSTFTLSCTNAAGTWTENAAVTVATPVTNTPVTNTTVTNTPVITPPVTTTGGGNGISYNSTPATVTAGQSFNITVSNTGTKTWGGGHDVGIKTGGSFIVLRGLGVTGAGGQKTVTMTAPSAPGTYSFKAVEQGVEEFGASPTFYVTQGANPVNNPGTTGTVTNTGSNTTTGGGSGNSNLTCTPTNSPNGPLSVSISNGNSATLSWNYSGGVCQHNWAGSMSTQSSSGTYTKNLARTEAWLLFCGPSGWTTPTAQFGVSATCAVPIPLCSDANASNNGLPAPCTYPAFTLSASPSTVKAKSFAGYSGLTEQSVNITVNPVYGFNVPVALQAISYPTELEPEFSFDGGRTFSTSPSSPVNLSSPYYTGIPIRIRFNGKLAENANHVFTFRGTGLSGGKGTGKTADVNVIIDSKPLFPDYREI